MKTKNKILLMLSGMCVLAVMTSLNVIAQPYFDPGVVSQSGTSTEVGIQNTGNDNWNFNGFDVEVIVWDAYYLAGWIPGIYWDEGSGTFTGWVQLGGISTPPNLIQDAQDPDVCLVTSGTSTLYAVVAYYSPGGDGVNGPGFYYEYYVYSSPAFSIVTTPPIFLGGANTQHVINIDGDETENFVIVWEDDNNNINYVSGNIAGGLCTSPSVLVTDAAMPDVALYAGSALCNCPQVAFTYVYTSGAGGGNADKLEVNIDSYSNVCAGTAGSSVYQTGVPAHGYHYYYPRVACTNANGANTTNGMGTINMQWSVVAEYNDGSTDFQIHGWTNDPSTTVYSHIYDDGSESPGFLITAVQNLRPVVTFDDQSGNVFVGWTFVNTNDPQGYVSSGGAVDAEYPIVLKCDYQGYVLASNNYWEVPTPVNTSDIYNSLSIAGRLDANDILYSYYRGNYALWDIFYKRVAPGASPLRTETFTLTEDVPSFYPNPSKGTFMISGLAPGATVTVQNTFGEIIYNKSASAPKTEINLSTQPSGVYFLTVKTEEQSTTGKLLISR